MTSASGKGLLPTVVVAGKVDRRLGVFPYTRRPIAGLQLLLRAASGIVPSHQKE
jgi:hypothetical protein